MCRRFQQVLLPASAAPWPPSYPMSLFQLIPSSCLPHTALLSAAPWPPLEGPPSYPMSLFQLSLSLCLPRTALLSAAAPSQRRLSRQRANLSPSEAALVSWPGGPWKGEVDKGTVEKSLTLCALSLSLVGACVTPFPAQRTLLGHVTANPSCCSPHPLLAAAFMVCFL